MKRFLILFLALCQTSLFAQKVISGKVLTIDGEPLEGAAVYFNSTSIGTTANDQGEFQLPVKEGSYLLIASYLGYETAQFSFKTSEINSPIVFKLNPKRDMLDEIVISKKKNVMSAEDRAYFLSRFKSEFLGRTNLSKECKIVNEDVIDFDYNPLSKALEASVSEPIIIEHKGLGYRIYYDLVHFVMDTQQVNFLGYTRYENLKGSKRKVRKWEEKRRVAYNGSSMHFLRSVMNNTVKQEGFIVDHFKKVPNPKRPSDSIIALAKKELRTLYSNNGGMNFTLVSKENLNDKDIRNQVLKKVAQNDKIKTTVDLQKMTNQDFQVTRREDGTFQAKAKVKLERKKDSLMEIINKGRLKRWVEETIRENIATSDFSIKQDNTYYLQFPHYLKVKYMNEAEEDNFRPGPAKLDYQVSMVTLLAKPSQIDPYGILINPLDLFREGYWSYEKIADSLPLDYTPTK